MPCCNHFATAMMSRMTQTIEVLRPTESRDRFGATTSDQNRVAHRYMGRLLFDGSPKDPTLVGDKSVVRSSWRIILAVDADVVATDLIRCEGQKFEVLDSDKGRSGASFLTLFIRKTT